MANLLWLLGVLFYGVACVISDKLHLTWFFFDGWTVVYMIPLCIAIAAYFHMIYAISGKNGQGAVIVFAVNVFMILCSGAVIPIAYLPEIAGKIGKCLPLSFWNEYCAQTVFGQVSGEFLLVQLVIILVATGIGAAVSWKNT